MKMILIKSMLSVPERGKETPSQALLQWNYVQDRLPWGIVLLLGQLTFQSLCIHSFDDSIRQEEDLPYQTPLKCRDYRHGLDSNCLV